MEYMECDESTRAAIIEQLKKVSEFVPKPCNI